LIMYIPAKAETASLFDAFYVISVFSGMTNIHDILNDLVT